MESSKSTRIESIDLLRGLVMVIMALDHSRHFFYLNNDPTDMDTTTPFLFFTRFITHFCAPVFVFLAGTSASLYGRGKTKPELFKFLFARGFWLVFLEIFLNDFIWFFDKDFEFIQLQVIWVIGISMICLSFMIFLDMKIILLTGIMLVACHNLLDNITLSGNSFKSVIWYILHQVNSFPLGEKRAVGISYPLIPWPGVMMLGYYLGSLYRKEYDFSARKKWLLITGGGMTLLFLILRVINKYGDPLPWEYQKNLIYTILSFFNVSKYPASLMFILIMLGPSLIFLALTEKTKNRLTDFFLVFGRVPLAYYFLHIFILHLAVAIIGGNWKGWIMYGENFSSGRLGADGYTLPVIYLIWICTVLVVYPCCKWYMRYKSKNRDKWWLSYL